MKKTLKDQWENLQLEMPKLRIRDAAKNLNVKEVELLATKIGETVKLLKPLFADFLKETPNLGYVMALTRNESCVHERKGVYQNISVNGQTALAVGDDIDLRIFLKDWKFGFYVEGKKQDGTTESFQFFDKTGEAVHKIYKTETSSKEGWELVKKKFIDDIQDFHCELEERIQKIDTNDPKNIPSFLEEWSALEDTHDFFSLLRKYDFSREFSLQAAKDKFAFPIPKEAFLEILQKVSHSKEQIMIFVGNPGMIQIHTGLIQRLETMGPWFNVLDPNFNLHLRTDQIHSCWIVNKPTRDGVVSSLEIFDQDGNLILQMFGKRKPGIPQSKTWFGLINQYIKKMEN